MPDAAVPPGWSYNPSAWSRRLPVLALAVLGCGIATYLTLYQVGALSTVWEPFFGNGSNVILKQSSVARLLPVPDAALGAGAYLLEVVAECLGGRDRWRRRPWTVLLVGLFAAGLGMTGILLAVCQPLLFHAFCTLCLVSATCSILILVTAFAEVLATVQHLKRETASGRPLGRAVAGL